MMSMGEAFSDILSAEQCLYAAQEWWGDGREKRHEQGDAHLGNP